MIEELRQYVKNKNTIEGSQPKQILGSDAKLKEFASFWARHGDDLMMVAAIKLHDFTNNQDFDRTQLDFYRKGIAEFGIFFSDCARILEEEAQKKELQNKSKGL